MAAIHKTVLLAPAKFEGNKNDFAHKQRFLCNNNISEKISMAQQTQSNVPTVSGEASVASANCRQQTPSEDRENKTSNSGQQAGVKRKRYLPEMPDPDAEVIVLSPKTLMATNCFICEICNKSFKRDQNLQMHRRGHNLQRKLKSKETRERVYICPEPTCVHHEPSKALGDLMGIKKHFCQKHAEKQWKCDKCDKYYALESDWEAHSESCGSREYHCHCGKRFYRGDDFITHQSYCDALAKESAPVKVNAQQGDSAEPEIIDEQKGAPASLVSPLSPFLHFESGETWLPRDDGSAFHWPSSPFAEPQSPIKLEGGALSSKSSPEPLPLESIKSQLSHKNPSTQKFLKRKAEQSPMTTFKTRSEVDHLDDGFRWRKYGQKSMQDGNNRHYYRCTNSNCHVKKMVERDAMDTEIVITTYRGKHNHESRMLKAQRVAFEEVKSRIPEDVMDQMSGPSEKFDVAPLHCPVSSGFANPDAEIFDLSTTGLMATNRSAAKFAEPCNKRFQGRQNLQLHKIRHSKLRQIITKDISEGEDIMVPDLTISNSAASSDTSSQLIDQILKTKADKPDFDLGQLIAQIDALLVNYDTQLRTKNAIPKKLPDLTNASKVSNFTDQVSKHVKQIAKQIRLYSGDKHHTIIGVLNATKNTHWTAVGFLLLGASLEDVYTINKNEEECLRLFMSMAHLSKVILQLQNLPDLKMELDTKLNESIHLIAIGAILSHLQKQHTGFGRVFDASRDGQELQQLSRDIDEMCKSLILHISAPTKEGLPSKAYQNNMSTIVYPAMDALAEVPEMFAPRILSPSFPETPSPRTVVKRSSTDVKLHPLLSHHKMPKLQRMDDVQRSFQISLELFRISCVNFANFNLNRVQLELSRLQWLVRLDFSGSNLLDNLLSGSNLVFEASNSIHHPLNALPLHLKHLFSLQYLGLESTLRLSSSALNHIFDRSVVNQRASKSVTDQIIHLFGITTLGVEQNLNEKRFNSSVVQQVLNEEKANSSVVDQISNKNKTDSSEIELLEMIGSNFSWSMDSSQEVLNLNNILFLPQRIGDLLGASDQNLQSIFHLPRIRDLSMLKVINLQSFICIRQQVMDLLPLKDRKMRISFHLPQHSRDLLTLNVLNLQTTLVDMSSSSIGKFETINPIVGNEYAKLVKLPEGRTFVEYKRHSMKVPVQTKQHRIFLVCYDWDSMKTFVDKLVKSLKAGGVNAIVIESVHWEMTDKKSFSSKQVSDGTNVHIPIFSKKNHLLHLQQWLCICRPNSIIRPLFYDVNEDIKYLYDKALNKLAKDSTDGIFSSLNAPPQASFLSGWSSLDYRTEWRLLKRVVIDILEMLNPQPLHQPLHAVGLEERIHDLTAKLELASEGLKMVVAICGVDGIGKTTLAKAIFNSLGRRFQARSFVASVKTKGLCELQEQILKDLSRKDILVKNIEHGKALMKAHLESIRALVILDGIDHSMQLEALSVDWLAPGSRLLLISRDTELLASAHADKIYEMDMLKFEESVELFSWHAFLRTYPDDGYEDRSQNIVESCGGNPFLLEVIGASLYGRTETKYWDESMRHLANTIDQGIHRRLCVSTQVLTNHELEIFLDIACFFVGKENLETASRFWEAIGHTPNRALENLIQNSLVLINDKKQFIMHDLLQDMGREMVADMSPNLGGRTRIWRLEDALHVIKESLGIMSIQSISISRTDRSNIAFKAESFSPMENLQLLWTDGEHVAGDFLNLCPDLIWLRWNSCPLKCLPWEWSANHLTVLDLSSDITGSPSQLQELWSQGSLYKEFKYLNVLRLRSAQYLERLPDFSIFPALMVLDLEDCPNLRSIPDSIGILEGLKCLNLSWCRNLAEVPCGISKLSSLEKLSLSHCSSLRQLPWAMEELTALKELDIGFSGNIEKLPNFGKLVNLEKLILAGCLSIRVLPDSIGELNNLKELDIQFLELILELPSLGNLSCLKQLVLSGCESLRSIPTSIGEIGCLRYLEMNKCSTIDCLPEEFGELVQLEELYINDCPRLLNLPSTFGNLVNLRILEMRHNPNLMQLPSSFSELPSLVWFDASGCNLLDGLHEGIGDLLTLGILNLDNNFFCQLPSSICKLTNLTKLNLNNCQSLEELPILPQEIVELDVGNCTQLIRLPNMSCLKRLRSLILCNCENLIEMPEVSSCQCLVVLNISNCVNIKSLSGVEGLKSLETLYFGGSGVSVLELNQYIKDMPNLEEVCIHANGVPWCLELKTGDHFLNDDNFTDILNYPIENNTKCEGIFLCLVLNFMHEYCNFRSSSGNSMELAIIADDQTIWVTTFSNRQNIEGDQLYVCMYGETHSLVQRMQAAHSINVKAKGGNIQVKECGMQLVNNGIANENFEIFLKDLNLLAESYTSKTSREDADDIEDDIPQRTRAELELDSGLYDYGYATSEGEYQTDEEFARWQ